MKGITMKSNLINLNPNYFEDTTIIRDKWLSALLGDEIDLTSSPFSRIDTANFLMEEGRMIKACIEMEEDCDYRMTECFNTFNTENNFDLDFQYTVFWRADEGDDWLYSNYVYVAVEPHKGGDIRGNYGDIRLYKVSDLASTGFLDTVIGWIVLDAETDEQLDENGEYDVGYWDNPTCHVSEDMEDFELKDNQWYATWQGRRVKLVPSVRGE